MPFIFENLEVYKKAMGFTIEVYGLNRTLQDRNIKDQLNRAAMSIPLNIAEGQGRMHSREKRQFYNTARGSLLECVPLIQLCYQLHIIEQQKYDDLYNRANEIGKMLNGLIKSIEINSRK
jgi:four helix bundle protein